MRNPPAFRLSVVVMAAAALLLAGCTAPVTRESPSVPATVPSSAAATSSRASISPDEFSLPTPQHLYTDLTSPDREVGPVPDVTVPGEVAAPGGGMAGYLNQAVDWQPCPSTATPALPTQCATVLAPLDWNDPDGTAITLAMKRLPATKQPSLGDLFINPGGPGGSAQDYVDSFDTTGLEQYTIVGVDPRGSGASTPVVCGTQDQIQAYFNLDLSPDNDAERTALLDGTEAFAQQCRAGSGALLDHISTIDAVYDFEMIRLLLGDATFNWFGASYGTYIGSVYAELYPTHVGRMVLDGAVNITDDESVIQADGFDLALGEYAKWCATDSTCSGFMGTSDTAVLKTITDFLTGLDANPIMVGDRPLTQSLAIMGIGLYMYSGTDGYQYLTNALQWTLQAGNGQYLLAAADYMNGKDPDTGQYGSLALSFPAIACADGGDKGIDDAWTQWAKDEVSAPIFGTYMGPGLICPVWTAEPAAQIDFSGAGAPPLIVIGGTGDNATPYQYAQWMAQQLQSAVLVTRNGVGHVSYGEGNTCINSLVQGFYADGTVPANGMTC